MMSANYRLSGPSGGESRIYVGNLPTDVRIRDIEDIFYKYGKIRDIDLKNKRGSPPFAFVEFEDPRDAQDAVYGRNGYDYGVYRLRVEFQRGRGAGGVGGGSRGRPGPAARRSDFRVIISGLPPSGSWQDLKDHMREAGDVCYADVLGEGAGVVEFFRKEDMDYAIRKLDDTKFRSHEVLLNDTNHFFSREKLLTLEFVQTSPEVLVMAGQDQDPFLEVVILPIKAETPLGSQKFLFNPHSIIGGYFHLQLYIS
ncbi:serine/arginine-rich splicing factor 9-like isoform X3 [Scyliorhinus canicula]|nr:serine/arginine-rich splicing factor 9-like isoform X3 [Scyliorhinus canicula]XP_038647823.1 serine/arginine-rich splicing factor 9-like isoform X3 [Scyliorhinus canicula]